MKHVSADVAAGNSQRTDEGDHDVSEILTDALARDEGVVDG
jgi:hypothetical protein